MDIALITGSSGLIGSEAVQYFAGKGLNIVGIDNDMRRYFFGDEASTAWKRQELQREIKDYVHKDLDIRDKEAVTTGFLENKPHQVFAVSVAPGRVDMIDPQLFRPTAYGNRIPFALGPFQWGELRGIENDSHTTQGENRDLEIGSAESTVNHDGISQ